MPRIERDIIIKLKDVRQICILVKSHLANACLESSIQLALYYTQSTLRYIVMYPPYSHRLHPVPISQGVTLAYSADRIMGKGSFGIVFEATIVETGQRVAVKRVLQDRRFKVCYSCVRCPNMLYSLCVFELRAGMESFCFWSSE